MVRVSVSQHIPFKVTPIPMLCKTIIEFGVGWNAIYCIPISTSFKPTTHTTLVVQTKCMYIDKCACGTSCMFCGGISWPVL